MADIEALVVGAGPVGLVTAIELARSGLSVRIIEKRAARSVHSKALAVHARTLELLEDLGLADAFLAKGHRMHGFSVMHRGQRLVHVDIDELDTPFPFILVLPQSDTEAILEEHLSHLGVTVERNATFIDLNQDDERVTAVFTVADEEHRVTANWLVGCDGAHSQVRKVAGIAYEGADIDSHFTLADVDIPDLGLPNDEGYGFVDEDGALLVLPLPDGNWRLVGEIGEAEASAEPDVGVYAALLERRCGRPIRIEGVGWMAHFRVRQRRAEHYRAGRVFVAGDAAHCHSPLGGQGMNTGIHDAHNLCWKLALANDGLARPSLLDSYEVERIPVADDVLRQTYLGTRAIMLRQKTTQAVRNQLLSFVGSLDFARHKLARNAAELDVNYRNSPVVGEHRSSVFFAQVFRAQNRETPTIADRLDFGAAPRPGDRAPLSEVRLRGEHHRRQLYELMAGTHHTLLLFDGEVASPEGYVNLTKIGTTIRKRYGSELIKTYVVVPFEEAPQELAWGGPVILDGDDSLHLSYGAGAECLYLIRPDSYIGFRSQPAELEQLLSYLDTIISL